MKLLGPSAFGPLKFRPVNESGAEGDWQPLASLVRMPDLKEVRCTPANKGGKAAHTDDKVEPSEAKSKSETEPSPENKLAAENAPASEKSAEPSAPPPAEPKPAETKPVEAKAEQDCTLTGDKLFLIDAVSADPDFTSSISVPDGFIEARLTIPAPKGKAIYIKLRDDPSTVDTAVVPVTQAQP